MKGNGTPISDIYIFPLVLISPTPDLRHVFGMAVMGGPEAFGRLLKGDLGQSDLDLFGQGRE